MALLPSLADAAGYSIAGRIVKSDGTPLEYNNASFNFEILSPNGTCIVYSEQINGINMTNTGGRFSVALGTGTRTYPSTALTVQGAMNNSSTFTCSGGATYTPASDDGRLLRVKFYDGNGWQVFSPDQVLRAVPYASEAKNTQTLGGFTEKEFIRVTGTPAPILNATDVTNLTTLLSGNSTSYVKSESDPTVKAFAKTSLPTCTTGQVLKADGTTFSCVSESVSGATGLASGDLAGSYPSPTIASIQGISINAPSPTSNQVLKFDGTKWLSSSLATSDITGLTSLLGTYQTTASFNAMVSSGACSPSKTMYWSSATGTFLCQDISISVGGDLSGTAAAAVVAKLNGNPIDSTTPSTGQFLKFMSGKWTPTTVTVGTVTSVTATAPLAVTNGTSTPSLSIAQATTGQAGYLSSSDYVFFNTAGTAVSSANSTNAPSTLVKRDASGNFNAGTITATLVGNATSATTAVTATNFTGSVGGDVTGTQNTLVVGKIQGVAVDVSAGYQDGDSLVYNSSAGKWVLKRAGACDVGWTKVSKGSPFCIKNLSTTGVNYYQAIAQCGSAGGDLCSLSQLVNSCTSGVIATALASNTTWANILDSGDNGRVVRCDTVSNVMHASVIYTSTQATMSSISANIVPYCCKQPN